VSDELKCVMMEEGSSSLLIIQNKRRRVFVLRNKEQKQRIR
jgi:hypothetical protein